MATTIVPPRTGWSWARAGTPTRSGMTADQRRASTVRRRRRMEPPPSRSPNEAGGEEPKGVGQKKGTTTSIPPRLSASKKVVQHAAELSAASRQRVFDSGRGLGMHRALDQARLLEVGQSG